MKKWGQTSSVTGTLLLRGILKPNYQRAHFRARRKRERLSRKETLFSQQGLLGQVYRCREISGAPAVRVQLLHQPPVRLDDVRFAGIGGQAENLQRLVARHLARNGAGLLLPLRTGV